MTPNTKLTGGLLLVSGLLGSACTAGIISQATGSDWQPPGQAQNVTVTFVDVSHDALYRAPVSFSTPNFVGHPTFSFDPYAASGSSNNSVVVPPSQYIARFTFDADGVTQTWQSQPFAHNYSSTCTDNFTGQTVSCTLYQLVLFNGYNSNPPTLVDGSVTSVSLSSINHGCANGYQPPIDFHIDCSQLTDPLSIANCGPFLNDVACNVYPTYRAMTGVALERTCPRVTYVIWSAFNGAPNGSDAGGYTDGPNCTIHYNEAYSVNPNAPQPPNPDGLNPGPNTYGIFSRDVHEILHLVHYAIDPRLDGQNVHPMFDSSQLELSRELGALSYADTLSRAQNDLANSASRSDCAAAQDILEMSLYIGWLLDGSSSSTIVSGLYSATIADYADSSAGASDPYDFALASMSSGVRLPSGTVITDPQQYLRQSGCMF
jgi:hypothetical protein